MPAVDPSQRFSNLFNSYAQSINKAYHRHGSLFERPFQRKEIESDAYFCQLVYYIHLNPTRHGLTKDWEHFPHSSYRSFLANKPTHLNREEVLEWFGDSETFVTYHREEQDLIKIRQLLIDE